jgi:hypothetical protein
VREREREMRIEMNGEQSMEHEGEIMVKYCSNFHSYQREREELLLVVLHKKCHKLLCDLLAWLAGWLLWTFLVLHIKC